MTVCKTNTCNTVMQKTFSNSYFPLNFFSFKEGLPRIRSVLQQCSAPHSFNVPKLKYCNFNLAQMLRKQKKDVLPFVCWKEWGMMGSVVGIGRQCWTSNSKLWAQFRKRRGLCSGSKSLFYGASHWDQSTFLPDDSKLRSTAENNPPVCFHQFYFFSGSRMQSVTGARASPEWQLKLEGWSCLQCKRAPNLCVAVVEQLWWSLCLSLFSRMGTLLEKRHSSRAEVSQVDWARFMLVKRSTGHLWLSELIGRLHSSVHWL